MTDFPQFDLYSLSARLERFEERFAVLYNEHLGEFRWPIQNLPAAIQKGDTVILRMETQKTNEDEKYARMRALLEELIN